MANEALPTDDQNSTATPTAQSAPTASDTSTTDQTTPNSDSQPTTDPLDAPDLLDGDKPAEKPAETDEEKADREAEEARRAALTDEERAAEDAQKAKDEAPLTGAPEDDYELDLPEGMTLDPAALEAVTPLAKELNLSNKGLSRLAAEAYPIVEGQVQKAQVEGVVALRKAWETDARALISGGKLSDGTDVQADPVYAGENFDTVMATAAKALDRFAGDRLFPNAKVNPETGALEPGTTRDFLKTSGLANFSGLIRALYVAGRSISEDNDFERTHDIPAGKLSREEKYYPHLHPKT